MENFILVAEPSLAKDAAGIIEDLGIAGKQIDKLKSELENSPRAMERILPLAKRKYRSNQQLKFPSSPATLTQQKDHRAERVNEF